MKTFFLIFALSILMLPDCLFSQDAKPESAFFKQIPSPGFFYYGTDSAVYIYRGNGLFIELQSANKKYSIWKHIGISKAGWATGKLLGFNADGNLVPVSSTGGSGIGYTDLSATSPISYNNLTGAFSMVANAYAPYGTVSFPGFGISHVTAAYGDHNHSGVYLTSYTETDPVYTAWNKSTGISIPHTQISDWATSVSSFVTGTPWTAMGYVTGTPWTSMGYLTANQAHTLDGHSNVTITANSSGEILKWNGTAWVNNTLAEAGIQPAGTYVTGTPWTGMGYLTSYTETDPTIYTWAKAATKPSYGYGEISGTPSPYTLPVANSTDRGGIKIGYTPQNNTLAVSLNASEQAYVGLTGPAVQYALSGYVNTVGGNSIFGSGDIPFVVPNTSVTYGKLSVYNAPTQGDALTYDATYGLKWTVQHSGSGTSGRVAYWNGTNSLTSNAGLTFDGTNLTVGGNITCAEGYRGSSDRRLKEHIQPIQSKISDIKLYQFEMKSDTTNRIHYGAIAQEVELIAPELVFTDEKGMKSIAYIELLVLKISQLEEEVKANKQGNTTIPTWIWVFGFVMFTVNMLLALKLLRK